MSAYSFALFLDTESSDRFFVPTQSDSLMPIVNKYDADNKIDILKMEHYIGMVCDSDDSEPLYCSNELTIGDGNIILLLQIFEEAELPRV